MITIQRVLCPVDLSEPSARALAQAVTVARWYGAEVIVLHAYTAAPPPASILEGWTAPPLSDADRQRIEDWVLRFAQPHLAPDVTSRIEIREGSPAAAIAEAARDADLLVISTHGRSGFQRLLLGSVTEKVIRTSACPVLTVPPRQDGAPAAVPDTFKRIVCATDFSPSSEKAVEYALSLAQESGSRLTLLHALDWPYVEPPENVLQDPIVQAKRRAMEDVRQQLRAAIPDDARTWCEAEEIIVSGRAHREIVRVATEQDAGLIVLGAQGRGALDRAFFGSTTSQVVRHAPCPVLTVRAGA